MELAPEAIAELDRLYLPAVPSWVPLDGAYIIFAFGNFDPAYIDHVRECRACYAGHQNTHDRFKVEARLANGDWYITQWHKMPEPEQRNG